MRILIIEDEPLTAEDLAADILSLRPHWKIVQTLGSVKQASEWLPQNKGFDLIFSDIQLGDGTCFELFQKLPPPAPVVFCTAYDQYAIDAFQANGIAYVLKPFALNSLQAAIEKCERLMPSAPSITDLMALLQPKPAAPAPARILVHHKDKIIPVSLSEVALFFLHHENTMLLRFDGQQYPIQQNLGDIEVMAGADFFRASRQHLVNRKAIQAASQYFARKLLVTLNVKTDEQVTISKEKVPVFLEWLAQG